MSAKDYLKKIGVHTCIYFTASTFLLLFLYFVLSLDLSTGLHPVAQICILPFSFLLATANVFFKYAEDWEIGWRVAIHYCLTLGGAFICLYLPNKAESASTSGGLILFVVLTVLILWEYFKKPMAFTTFERWCIAAIYGGGLGNMIDRVRLGYVVDMIETEFITFPVFNLADCFITCGCILLMVHLVFFNKAFWKEEKK